MNVLFLQHGNLDTEFAELNIYNKDRPKMIGESPINNELNRYSDIVPCEYH